MANDSKRFAMVCSRCGSDDVSRDAWADWDIGTQQWVLRCAFDYAHCHQCDGETSITEVELAPEAQG
jgi:hypothetical protein